MNTRFILRFGAIAAVLGVVITLIVVATEPTISGDAAEAMNEIAGDGFYSGNRYLDVIGTALIFLGLAVITSTFRDGPAHDWGRLGQFLLAVGFACGAIAIIFGIAVYDVASAGVEADAALQPGYMAAVDALGYAVVAAFSAAFTIVSLYLATLAAAILSSQEYPRWIGYVAAVGSVLMFVGVPGYIFIAEELFLVTLLGFVLWLVVTASLGVKLWQRADGMSAASAPATSPDSTPAPSTT